MLSSKALYTGALAATLPFKLKEKKTSENPTHTHAHVIPSQQFIGTIVRSVSAAAAQECRRGGAHIPIHQDNMSVIKIRPMRREGIFGFMAPCPYGKLRGAILRFLFSGAYLVPHRLRPSSLSHPYPSRFQFPAVNFTPQTSQTAIIIIKLVLPNTARRIKRMCVCVSRALGPINIHSIFAKTPGARAAQ